MSNTVQHYGKDVMVKLFLTLYAESILPCSYCSN